MNHERILLSAAKYVAGWSSQGEESQGEESQGEESQGHLGAVTEQTGQDVYGCVVSWAF